jgi:hypothetical protein
MSNTGLLAKTNGIRHKLDVLEQWISSHDIDAMEKELNATVLIQSPPNITIRIPFSVNSLRKLRKWLGPDWRYEFNYIGNFTRAYCIQYLNDNGMRLIVSLSDVLPGSMCRLVKDGINKVEEDTYKVVCI